MMQLSITIGILLAYLLGMFVPWRLLAVLGNMAKSSAKYDLDARNTQKKFSQVISVLVSWGKIVLVFYSLLYWISMWTSGTYKMYVIPCL